MTDEEDQELVDEINKAAPDIVWVGLSTPKQELWMDAHRSRLTAPILVGVGAAFDIHAGTLKQAPPWMQRRGLEWLYRLLREPRRLWRRYSVHRPPFHDRDHPASTSSRQKLMAILFEGWRHGSMQLATGPSRRRS